MPIALRENQIFDVEHKYLPSEYSMNSLDMATDHYNIGYVVSGDRKAYLLDGSYTVHPGTVTLMAPFVYHRTVSISNHEYERFQVKYSQKAADSIIQEIGQPAFDLLNEVKVFPLEEPIQSYVAHIFEEMEYEYKRQSKHADRLMQGLLDRLLITLVDYCEVHPECLKGYADSYPAPINRQIVDALYYMENHYMHNPSLKETASTVFLSQYYFSHLFKAQTGKTYSEYLNLIKLRHAQELLVRSQKAMSEIAQLTGYPNGSYLCDVFKKYLGISPKDFRKNNR